MMAKTSDKLVVGEATEELLNFSARKVNNEESVAITPTAIKYSQILPSIDASSLNLQLKSRK